MIRAGVTWCLLVLSGCAAPGPVVREAWLEKVRTKGEGICSWSDARWEDRGTLLVNGTATRLGRARALWRDGTWAGALVTGSLRKSGPVLVFEGRWSRDGVTVEGTVDAGEDAVFRAHEARRIGSAGLVVKGGALRLVEAAFGKVLAQPAADALVPFEPVEPPLVEVPCSVLTLHGPPTAPQGRSSLALAGFSTDAPERFIPERAALEAAAQPGGELVGRFLAKDEALQGYVLAEAGEEARFAVPTPSGALWVGWVPKGALQSRPAPEVAAPQAPAKKEDPSDRLEWRSCPDDELVLSVARGGKLLRVGFIARHTPFVVGRRSAEGVEVSLAAPWLELEPDVALVVDATALSCPRAIKTDS